MSNLANTTASIDRDLTAEQLRQKLAQAHDEIRNLNERLAKFEYREEFYQWVFESLKNQERILPPVIDREEIKSLLENGGQSLQELIEELSIEG